MILVLSIASCGHTVQRPKELEYLIGTWVLDSATYPIENKYWTVEDYEEVIREIKFGVDSREGNIPTFNDPETKIVMEKLTDQENFKVVLEDKELGLKHRNEMAQGFFDAWNSMNDIYSVRDKTDKFIYENEMIAIYNFGLGLQLNYFKLGNEEILTDSDDPSSSNTHL